MQLAFLQLVAQLHRAIPPTSSRTSHAPSTAIVQLRVGLMVGDSLSPTLLQEVAQGMEVMP
jgi:hypothetical protein